jgi:hypothetical protein
MKENFKLVDTVEVCIKDRYGNIKSKRIVNNGFWHRLLCKLGLKHNSILAVGMAEVAALICYGVAGTQFRYIAIGDDDTEVDIENDTGCGNEITRVEATGSRLQTDYDNDTAQWTVTIDNDGGNLTGTDNICEVIVVNASSEGTALLRQVYSPADTLNWDNGDTLTVTVKVQIKQGS